MRERHWVVDVSPCFLGRLPAVCLTPASHWTEIPERRPSRVSTRPPAQRYGEKHWAWVVFWCSLVCYPSPSPIYPLPDAPWWQHIPPHTHTHTLRTPGIDISSRFSLRLERARRQLQGSGSLPITTPPLNNPPATQNIPTDAHTPSITLWLHQATWDSFLFNAAIVLWAR